MRRGADWQWAIREVLREYPYDVLFVTVTAPGDDVLPRGSDGRCEYGPLSEWCATLMERWHGLRDRCRKKALGSGSGLVVMLYVWQLQARGAPHIHIVVPAGPVGRRFADAVKASAGDFGFGFVDIRKSSGSAHAVGSYVSRYVTRDIESPDDEYAALLPRRPCYIDRRLSRRAGVGIAVARKVRQLWVYANRDDAVGVPVFESDWQESATFYWYRVGRHGFDNVRKPAILVV